MHLRLVVPAFAGVLLTACGGGGGGSSSGLAPEGSPTAGGNLTGGATKGPIRGADVIVCGVDDCEAPEDQTTTDSAGNFTVSVPAHGRFFVTACGGSFVDESDPAPIKRTIDLDTACMGSVLLPIGANTIAYNSLTIAVQQGADRTAVEKQAQCPAVRREHVFDALSAQVSSAFGFNVLTTVPQGDPTNPGGSLNQKKYSMAVGGIAQAINEAAGRRGLTAMDVATILDVISDLSDGVLDAQEDGQSLGLPPNPLSLNAQIQRFRNNNADVYSAVPVVVVDENQLTADVNLGPYAADQLMAVTSPGGTDSLTLDDVTAAACDAEGDTISGAVVFPTQPANGDVSLVGSAIVYTHDGSATTDDSFTYRLTDATGKQGPPATVLVTISPEAVTTVSRFDTGGEGWREMDFPFSGHVANPSIDTDDPFDDGFGLPPGSTRYLDSFPDTGAAAPAAYHGDKTGFYGGTLLYDIYVRVSSGQTWPAVALSNGLKTVYWVAPSPPVDVWQHSAIPLTETGWVLNDPQTGGPATQADMLEVLGNLTGLYIYTEWLTGSGDDTSLDNVVMTAATLSGDDDADNLSDAREAALGTNPHNADSDNDGFSDFFEVSQDGNADNYDPDAGDSDPNDDQSVPNSPPVISGDLAIEVPAGGNYTITIGDLAATDAEDLAADLEYTLLSTPTTGEFGIDGQVTDFDQADVNSGSLYFEHDGTTAGSEQVSIRLEDSDGAFVDLVLTITIYIPGANILVSHAASSPVQTGNAASNFSLFANQFNRQVSDDGRYVVFQSDATDLVSGQIDTNGLSDVFLFDRNTGVITLVSRAHTDATGKTAANNQSVRPTISGDGRYVAYTSVASNLVSGVTDALGFSDAFVFDRLAGTSRLVSHGSAVGELDPAAGGSTQSALISRDGNYIVFESNATNVVVGQNDSVANDIFLYDRAGAGGSNVLVSHNNAANTTDTGNGVSTLPVISDDGRFVAYLSASTNLVSGQSDSNGGNDVFLYDRNNPTATTLVSHTGSGTQAGNNASAAPSISADGSHVAYQSSALNIVSGVSDGNSGPDIFLFNGGVNRLVSRSVDFPTVTGNAAATTPAISGDGRFVVFASDAGNFLTGFLDGNGAGTDIFIFDSTVAGANPAIALVSHSTAGAARGANGSSIEPVISADGSHVGYRSAAFNLIGDQSDIGGLTDVFRFSVADGINQLVSRTGLSVETAADGVSSQVAFDADGSTIAFRSVATNLVPSQSDVNSGAFDIFLHSIPTSQVVDEDGDGLTDLQESRFGTNPFDSDSDGDGASDFNEVNQDGFPEDYNPGAGDTDPLDAGDVPAVCTVAPPGLIAWYPGDGNADDIQGTHDGAFANGATTAPGKVSQAFSLDNTTQHVTVSSAQAPPLTDAVTIDAWVNSANYVCGDTRRIVTKIGGGGPFFGYSLDLLCFGGEEGKLRFELHDAGGVNHSLKSLSIVPAGQFTHVAGTYDGATMKLYIDGVLDNSLSTGPFTIGSNGSPFQIGAFGGGQSFNGLIDEVAIFNRALAAPEIAAIHAADSAGKCKPPSPDSDGDGLSDALETNLSTNAGLQDSDSDGYTDYAEVNHGGNPSTFTPGQDTDPNDPDSDNDDINDYLEFNAGSSPTTPETSANRFYLKPSGGGDGSSWPNAAGNISAANSWLNSRPSAGVFYVLFAQSPSWNYGGQFAVNDFVAPGNGVSPFSVVVAIGGLDPLAPATLQGLYQAEGSILDGGADCTDGVPAGSGPLVFVGQEDLSNLGLIGLKLMNGQVFGGNNGGAIQTPPNAGLSSPKLVLTDSKIGNSCSQQFGGGIYLANNWDLEIYNSEISGNQASAGGGIYGDVNTNILLSNSDLSGNVVAVAGGGVYFDGVSLNIFSGKFQQNLVFGSGCAGGAIFARPGGAGVGDLLIEHSLFASNTVVCGLGGQEGGGALYLGIVSPDLPPGDSGDVAKIAHSRFLSNNCISEPECVGGAMHIEGNPVESNTSVTLLNNLIVGNTAEGPGGGVKFSGNNGGYGLSLNTIAYNQSFALGAGAGGGFHNGANAAWAADHNIIFFNDNGDISPTHDLGEDCKATLVFGFNNSDTIGSNGAGTVPLPYQCVTPATGFQSGDPGFVSGFYLNQAGPSVNTGSTNADTFFCNLVGCPPDHPFTTNAAGSRDTGLLDRGFHHQAVADGTPNSATPAPGQSNNVAPSCGLSYSFTLSSPFGQLGDGHLVAVCLTSAAQATDFKLTGQGTLDPINNNGTASGLCAEAAVLAKDSGINGIYSVSLDGETISAAGGPHNLGLLITVDGALGFAHTITGATFGALCGTT